VFLAVVIAAGLAGGCKKHETVITATASPPDDLAASSPGPPIRGPGPIAPPPASIVVPDTGDVNVTLDQLSLELRKYVVRARKVPKTFEEFIAQSNVHPPPAPAGKKYAIHGQVIVLVKQ